MATHVGRTSGDRQTVRPQDGFRASRLRLFNDIIEVENQFYILASSSLAEARRLVLKQGETFAVFDPFGDVKPLGKCDEGVFHEGTRFLSGLMLSLGDHRPLLLSSSIKEDNALLTVDLTNPDVSEHDEVKVPRGTLHLARSKYLWDGVCHERLRVRNFGLAPVTALLKVHFEADFADIFEVRGTKREHRGRLLDAQVEGTRVMLPYEGLDRVKRTTVIDFSPQPNALSGTEAQFEICLQPSGEANFYIAIACVTEPGRPRDSAFDSSFSAAEKDLKHRQSHWCRITTSNEQFNDWLHRTGADLNMMVTETAQGPFPYAGVPWFSTAFGRDGIITALECLWVNPTMARGVLAYLAATQAKQVDPQRDAEPGKILHETRKGEMAALGEVPFGRYYGSVDSTPLFIMLAGAYALRTHDRAFIESIWLHIELALQWIDTYGDRDHDGFVEYARQSPTGLQQQGWKDSQDSVFHSNGELAAGPIALCEVQGYVFAAKLAAADLATMLGKHDRAEELRRQANALRERFEEAFWCEDLDTYALALDGQKQPCRVRASNAGHCLATGIASPERARRVAATLLSPASFSGWGVRTIAGTEARFNPMSYHNGSVWPHDNAIIAHGLARYGLKDEVLEIMTGLFDLSLFVDMHRVPELVCGFERRPGEGPTLYPVACAPQAWAAASQYMLLQACLGMEVHAAESKVYFFHPMLPESLRQVRIRGLQVGSNEVDIVLIRHGHDVGVDIERRSGDVSVLVVK